MSYEAVLEQVKTAPEACLDEISQIISYVVYRHERQNGEIESFSAGCESLQKQTKAAGITEQNLYDFIKESRQKNRAAKISGALA